jgi:hypothetical protein
MGPEEALLVPADSATGLIAQLSYELTDGGLRV